MLAREVRERCKGRVDDQVRICLEALAERQSVINQEMMMMGQMIDQMSNLLANFVTVADNMQSVTEKLQKIRGDDGSVASESIDD